MSLDQIIDLQISIASRAPTRAGFGTPLIAAYHEAWADYVREYAEADDLLDDGFTTASPAYRAAKVLGSQNPRPRSFKVGRRASAFTQTFTLTPINVIEGFVYEIPLTLPDGSAETVTYTVPSAATPASIATALTALFTTALGAFGGAADSTGFVTITADVGELIGVDLSALDPINHMAYADTTTDPGLAADLALIKDEDDQWYCLLLDSNSPAEVKAAAAWLEDQKKIGHLGSSDSEIIDAGVTDDLASDLKALAYRRIALWFDPNHTIGWLPHGIAGQILPKDPGTYTIAFKTIAGVTGKEMKPSHKTAAGGKRANHYSELGGVNITYQGISPSGEYLDTIRFVDMLYARIQEAIYGALLNNDKLPYDDMGASTLAGVVRAVLKRHTSTSKVVLGLAASPAPVVTVDPVSEADPADVIERIFRTVRFTAKLSGAIHNVTIRGSINP